ncbi:hypothetical protein [Acidianus sp. HS-5]|uniref:hypothetical protein n=1 Tax=Acidianus sp. HS-5 TaxID=2886040 RepID=UPI001F31AAEA|nr:hypothetical protein [Acidianus sp. HS-5]BDC17562.1 hypothetical protein HS5_04520 [Acidianus sp. HS-5]
MISIPSISTTDIASLIVAFVLGLLVGVLIKKITQVAIILVAIIIILIFIGAISPTTIEHELIMLGQQASTAESEVSSYIKLLPYNSVAFIIGLVIGLWKG